MDSLSKCLNWLCPVQMPNVIFNSNFLMPHRWSKMFGIWHCLIIFQLSQRISKSIPGLCRASLGTTFADDACIIRTKNHYPGNMPSEYQFVSILFQNHLLDELICLVKFSCSWGTRCVLQMSMNKCFTCGRETSKWKMFQRQRYNFYLRTKDLY